jgi:hypothetical protein
MNDVVVIPTFDRPEFLWTCLENIWNNVRGIIGKYILISEDVHADKPKDFTTQMEMLATIREWQNKFADLFHYRATPPHTTYGNSYNVLSALQQAANISDGGKIYLIEDDVLVTPDFFEWNDLVFETWPATRLACAGRLNRSLNFHINGPHAIDESIKDPSACRSVRGSYISWATCFGREMRNMFQLSFDYSKFRPGFEQDIMLQQYINVKAMSSTWPYVPRAYHMGWWSYHRNGGFPLTGNLEERVTTLQKIVSDPEKLRTMVGPQEMDAFPKKMHEPTTRVYFL